MEEEHDDDEKHRIDPVTTRFLDVSDRSPRIWASRMLPNIIPFPRKWFRFLIQWLHQNGAKMDKILWPSWKTVSKKGMTYLRLSILTPSLSPGLSYAHTQPINLALLQKSGIRGGIALEDIEVSRH